MSTKGSGFVCGLVALVLPVLAPAVAHADAIDGNWCARDGRVMTIDGPAIVTPGGSQISGSYSRHAFSYVVPPGESDAGATILMILLNEDTVRLDPGNGAANEIWHRCDVTS
jgi:hypothetical protein